MALCCRVKGLGSVFHEMTLIRTQEITKVLVEHLKKFATQFSLPGRPFQSTLLRHPSIARIECVAVGFFFPQLTAHRSCVCQLHNSAGMQTDLPPPLSLKTGCRQNIASDADWLKANLGPFTTLANYSDLKELNVSGVKYQPSLMFLLSYSFNREFDWHLY